MPGPKPCRTFRWRRRCEGKRHSAAPVAASESFLEAAMPAIVIRPNKNRGVALKCQRLETDARSVSIAVGVQLRHKHCDGRNKYICSRLLQWGATNSNSPGNFPEASHPRACFQGRCRMLKLFCEAVSRWLRVVQVALKKASFWSLRWVQKTSRCPSAALTTEAVEGAALALEGVHDVHGGDGLAAGVLGVGDGVTDHVLEEDLEHPTGLLVDEAGDALDTTTTGEAADGGLGDALDVVAQDLAVALGAALSESLASFSTARHDARFEAASTKCALRAKSERLSKGAEFAPKAGGLAIGCPFNLVEQ
eukprot:scaffold7071_cov260-Pinguiococcus_pyrenoidosus.AAC.11